MNLSTRWCVVAASLCALGTAPADAAPQFRGGAVAAAHPLASQAAADILKSGGNAVDAAVAAAFVMAVVGPYHSGLGGGGFAVVHLEADARRRAASADGGVLDVAFDFREVAPAAATRDMFLRDGGVDAELSTDGALSVAVPGAVKGYLELLERYGTLPRARVLAAAKAAAKDGFVVTSKYRGIAREREDCLRADAEAARICLRPNAKGVPSLPAEGAVLTQPELKRTLELLEQQGAAAFYEGPLADKLVRAVQKRGGVLSLADLKNFRTRVREPLVGSYRGHRIHTMPPPSAGGIAVLQALGALERLGPLGLASREVPVLHTFVEALRRSYVDRARYLGDPAFTDIPLARLVSPAAIDQLFASIDQKRATPSSALSPTRGQANDSGVGKKNTTHISVIDRAGNAVALTTTVNYGFGSCLVAPGTGVLLNDEMDDFAAAPLTANAYELVTGEANTVAPGKIPLSSMSPTLVFSRGTSPRVMLAVGSPGGSTIPTTVAQVISNVVDARMNVGRAVGFGRIHHQWMPDHILVDAEALDPLTEAALRNLGHKIEHEERWGDAEAAAWSEETGLFSSASDPRNEGQAAGVP